MSTQNPQDRYIEVESVKTRYWALGDEGTTVILIHGIGAAVESWALNIHALAEHHRVYALDLVGFGYSDKPPARYSYSYLSQFVADFMKAQAVAQASLVGHSLGGGVALKLAIQHPEKVEKLVLVGSTGLGREAPLFFRLSSLPIVGEFLTRPSRKGTAQFLRECFYDPAMVTEEMIEQSYGLDSLPGAQETYLSTVRAIANIFGGREGVIRGFVDNLGKITAPTLIVWGKQDRILPVAHGHVAEERIAGAQFHIFEECGHVPPMEKAEAFNALVSEFLVSSLRQ